MSGNARVFGYAMILEHARVGGDAHVHNGSVLRGESSVGGYDVITPGTALADGQLVRSA